MTVDGLAVARCRPGDAGFDQALGAAVGAVAAAAGAGDAHAAAVLGLLRDTLRIVTGARVDPAGLTELLEDPAGHLAAIARARLTAGEFLGLLPDAGAPGAQRRWVRTLAPGLRVAVTSDAGVWELRVDTPGPGLALAEDVRLRFDVTAGPATTATTWQLDVPGLTVGRDARGVEVVPAGADPVRVWPLRDATEAAAAGERLLALLPACAGAGLLSALLARVGIDLPAAGLMTLLRDPVGELLRRPRAPGFAELLLPAIGEQLGLTVLDDGRVVLVDGVVAVAAPQVGGSLALDATFTGAGLPLSGRAGILVGPLGTVAPTGALDLTVPLPTGAMWPSVTLGLAQEPDGLHVAVTVGTGPRVELVPRFSGFTALVGEVGTRLLPMVLDQLRDALPDGPVRAAAIDLARAVGIHGTGFGDGPVALRDLDAATLAGRAPQIGAAAAKLVAVLCGIDPDGRPGAIGTGSVTVTDDGAGGIAVAVAGPLGVRVTTTLALAGPALTVELAGLDAGPLALDLAATATMAGGALAVSGQARVDVDLHDPLRISSRPRLQVALAADGSVTVVLLPLGADVAPADLSFDLAPVPAAHVTATGAEQAALRLLVTPALEAAVRLLGDALGVELGSRRPGDPEPPLTLRALLTGAHLLDGEHVRSPLPAPLEILTGAAAAIASTLDVEVADGLALHVLADDANVGVVLRGTVGIAAGEWQPNLLFGAPGKGGLQVVVLSRDAGGGLGGTGWKIAPALALGEVGMALTRSGGLVNTDLVTVQELGATLGTTFELDPATGKFTVAPLSAGLRVTGLGLPALSGGSTENPVAGSLLGDAARNGAPVNPPLSFHVGWTGTDLELRIEGSAPGVPLWIPVGKTFGPLHIERVGILGDQADITVDGIPVNTAVLGAALDGGLAIGPLAVAVAGLSLSIPPRFATRPATWRVDLDGLAVDVRTDAVTIVGGLLKAVGIDADGNPLVDYRGMLQVQALGLGATALGAFSRVRRADGSSYASLFVFAAINVPLGGPPFLFVTGVAGGFGVNRALLPPPSPDQVGAFPLVAVMGDLTTPADKVLAEMGPSLPPRDGAYWIAAGLTFTTFELIHTRALAYFAITPQGFELGVLGLMTAGLPSAEFTLANVELGLRAVYSSVDQTVQPGASSAVLPVRDDRVQPHPRRAGRRAASAPEQAPDPV
ncbi:MAG: DUF6603 domain-containing protein, partial [Pseudonocardia sp.]